MTEGNTKFSIEMPELRKHVNFVRNGLGASKTDLPVMLFRFYVGKKKITIFAANKEIFCRTEAKITRPEGEDTPISFAVLGNKIEKLIAQVEAEQVNFNVDNENVEISAGFLTVNFELFDGSSLKTIEKGLEDHLKLEGLTMERSGFEEALACAKSCTTINSIRPDVTHVELRKGRMLSSDGRKIMIYSHDGFPEEMVFKCPSSALNNTLTAVKNIESQHIQVIDGPSYYFLKGNRNEYTMGVRKIERDFPAVESQIETKAEPTDEVSIDKHVFEAMLRGVALGLPTDEVKVTVELDGKAPEAFLEVSATNNVGRKSHERASCGRKAEKAISFPLSFKHLLDTLAVFKGDSVVDMMIVTKLSLLMVRDSTEHREVMTIIPFRTDKQIEAEKKEREAAEEARKKEAVERAAVEGEDAGELVENAAELEDGDLDLEEDVVEETAVA